MTRLRWYPRNSIMAGMALFSLSACLPNPPGTPSRRGEPAELPEGLTGPNAPTLVAAPRDSTAEVVFALPNAPRENWNVVNGAVQDTIFRYVSSNYSDGRLWTRSITRGLALYTHLVPLGADSTLVVIRGQRYTGNSPREGFTLAGAEHWPPIRRGDADVERLVSQARRIMTGVARARRAEQEQRAAAAAAGRAPPTKVPLLQAPVSADSIVRILSDGTLGFCRANTVHVGRHLDTLLIVDVQQRDEWCPVPSYLSRTAGNTWILANPRSVAIGDTISVCWVSRGTRGFRFATEGWYMNRDRCSYDASEGQRSEPNMVLLRRLR